MKELENLDINETTIMCDIVIEELEQSREHLEKALIAMSADERMKRSKPYTYLCNARLNIEGVMKATRALKEIMQD